MLHYNRQEAVQRNYSPQGLIGLMARDLSGPPHFINVDLDDPFFRQIEIEVESPIDFGRIGLLTADVELEYGDRGRPAELKRKDMRFEQGGPTKDSHAFFMNADHDLSYRVKQQYHFDPLSGWEGSAFSYELPTETTLDRTLLLNPFNHFGFLELTVVPGDLDWGMIRETEVQLRYDGGHWRKDTTLSVRPDSPEQAWRLRLDDPERREFSYTLRHHMKDGSVHESAPVVQRATAVTVNDPFDDPLIIEFFPNYDPAGVRVLFVDVLYEDEANDYRREERIEFRGDSLQSQRLRIARFDPARREFTFRLTKLAPDHSVERMPPVRTEETIVFLGEHFTT